MAERAFLGGIHLLAFRFRILGRSRRGGTRADQHSEYDLTDHRVPPEPPVEQGSCHLILRQNRADYDTRRPAPAKFFAPLPKIRRSREPVSAPPTLDLDPGSTAGTRPGSQCGFQRA